MPVPDRGATWPASARSGRNYALGLLLAVYSFNMIDRQILAILGEPIKAELGLSDTQLGFLTGFAFALFYAVAGIPIAMLADRLGRRSIIAFALALWSGMTALSGLAQNFSQLALARIGVGIGEAGCSPPSHSIIADYYPVQSRARALGIFGLGIPIGTLFGISLGGWIAANFGWRAAFFLVGLPGLVLAVLVRLTLKEPQRGAADHVVDTRVAPGLGATLRYLAASPTFIHLAAGGAIITAVSGAMVVWAAPFLMRSHGFSLTEAGIALGLIAGIPGAAGVYLGGALADRLGRRNAGWRLWTVSAGLVLACPFAIAAWLVPGSGAALALLIIPFVLCTFFYQATTFAQVQSISPVRMRATAAAILLFVMNLIGQGGGPQLVGILSDALKPAFGAHSLRYALALSSVGALWAAWHYWRAGQTLTLDIEKAAGANAGARL